VIVRLEGDWLPLVTAALTEIRAECADENWDGEASKPVTAATLTLATTVASTLFASLPQDTPAPDVVPEADGDVCFTWRADDEHVLSVSIGEHGNASYAAQIGREGGSHGWTPLGTVEGETLDHSLREIAAHIEHVYGAAHRTGRS
jgi:hypothetical protein